MCLGEGCPVMSWKLFSDKILKQPGHNGVAKYKEQDPIPKLTKVCLYKKPTFYSINIAVKTNPRGGRILDKLVRYKALGMKLKSNPKRNLLFHLSTVLLWHNI